MDALVYYHDTLQLCRTGHDGVSHTGITTEFSPLDCLSYSALYFEYHQYYFHETIYSSVEEVVIICHVYKIWQL